MDLEQKIEALTNSVDLVYSMQQNNEQKLDVILQRIDTLEAHFQRAFLEIAQMSKHIVHVDEVVGALAHNSNTFFAVIQEHEDRISALENNQAAS